MRCGQLPALLPHAASRPAPIEAAPSLSRARHRAAASRSAPLAHAWRGVVERQR